MNWKSLTIGVCIVTAGCAPTTYQGTGRNYAPSIIQSMDAELASFGPRAYPQDIIITTGLIAQSHVILGPVHANTEGMINTGAILTDAVLRGLAASAIQASPKATIPEMNMILQDAAWEQYRDHVDAVINVSYHTDPDGNVSANGLAVQFVQTP